MPRYSLNAFGRKIPLADTSEPLSKQVGRRLQGQPDTKIDSGGSVNTFTFDGQEISSSELREIREIRESGGVISALMRSKALLTFGAGVSFEVEDNESTLQEVNGRELTLEEYLRDRLNDIDSLVLELGEDALYYPYAVAEPLENRRGGFGGIAGVEPYTVIPETDEYGDIVRWIQTTENGEQDMFAPDELVHFPLNKSSARDKTGISSILRSREEIEQFRANQQAIKSAIELHGFPQRHVKVGREGSAPIRDNELRRVRNLFDSQTVDSDTVFVTGRDVEIDALEAENFEFERVSENDMRQLSLALGVPLELTNYGSDGLGSGKPAEFRLNLFKLQIEANQRQFANIFVRDLLRPVLRDMTPFNHTVNINMEFGDPLQTEKDMATLLNEIGDYMTNEEISERFELPKPEDDKIAESYRTPAEVEQAEEQDAGAEGAPGPFGLSADSTQTALLDTPEGVPDNAQYLPPGESPPEGATTFPSQGEGSYYVPQGESDNESNTSGTVSPDEVTDASEIQADNIEFSSEDVGNETQFSFHALDDEVQFDMGVPEDGDSAMAYHMWIDDSQRGQGVGSELMKAAEQKARDAGMDNLNATIGGDPEAAQSFFESLGYETGIIEDGELIEPEGAEWAYFHKPLDEQENSRENRTARDINFSSVRLAKIPDKYVEDTGLSESDFIPNSDVADVIEPVLEFIDEHGLPNPDDQQEGAARINQLWDAYQNDDPIHPDFWEEIANFHARHRAQGNHECDESSLPEEAEEINQNEFEPCLFDPGYFSDKTWGGTPGMEQAERIVDAIESTEGVELADHTPEWDAHLLEMHNEIHDNPGRELLEFSDSQTPQFVKDRLRDAILDGAVFNDFDTVDTDELFQLREFMIETLQSDGWTIDGLADQLEQLDGVENKDQARRIARTETASVVNTAREDGYTERGDEDGKFYWTGATSDGRTTDTCKYLVEGTGNLENPNAFSDLPHSDGTDPFEGGTPLGLEELKDHIEAVAEADPEFDTKPRTWTPHINCRKTFVKAPDSMT